MGPIVTAMLRGMLPRDAHIAHKQPSPGATQTCVGSVASSPNQLEK